MFRLLTAIFFLMILSNCNKENENPTNQPKISFEFKGKKYEITDGVGIMLYNDAFEAILISRPDLFGGTITFHKSSLIQNCAYLSPTNQYITWDPGCILKNNGTAIDSVQVYLYRSGTLNYTKSNIRRKKERTTAGTWVEYDVYDLTGTFSLTLGNKNNQTISVTKGSFIYYEIRL